MIINISRYFEVEPSVIEIHPSAGMKNPFGCIVEGIIAILDAFQQTSKIKPLILLENRTYKQISNGREIRDFWGFLVDNNKELIGTVGIVLDFKTLFTQNKADLRKRHGEVSSEGIVDSFKQDLMKIPSEALKAYHIHGFGDLPHQIPKENDEIPWKNIFEKIKENKSNIIINPEVLNHIALLDLLLISATKCLETKQANETKSIDSANQYPFEKRINIFFQITVCKVVLLWPCKSCGHENPDEAVVCENCGALMDEVGDSGDNKDSEDLFFDDEGI